jgi:hypothetical protein
MCPSNLNLFLYCWLVDIRIRWRNFTSRSWGEMGLGWMMFLPSGGHGQHWDHSQFQVPDIPSDFNDSAKTLSCFTFASIVPRSRSRREHSTLSSRPNRLLPTLFLQVLQVVPLFPARPLRRPLPSLTPIRSKLQRHNRISRLRIRSGKEICTTSSGCLQLSMRSRWTLVLLNHTDHWVWAKRA